MKKFIKMSIVVVVAFSLLGATGLIKSKNSNADTTTNYIVGAVPKTVQNLSALGTLGYQLNVPNKPALISPDTAVKNAKLTYPGLNGNTAYTVEYQVLTLSGFSLFSQEALDKNPVLNTKKKIEHLPVYIITYENMLVPIHSSIGTNPPADTSVPQGYAKCEYNIVVDASSGVTLLAFQYR